MGKKWNKEIVKREVLKLKQTTNVSYSKIRKYSTPLRGAIDRCFSSFQECLAYCGLNYDEEKEDRSGENNPFYGKTHSEETRRKISKFNSGRYSGEGNPNYGKKHNKKVRAKISNKVKEHFKNFPQRQSGKNNHMYGKKQSAESNNKRSESLKKFYSKFEKFPFPMSEDGKNRVRKARVKSISEQKSSYTDIELLIMEVLDEMNVDYEFQYPFKYFCVDFYLKKFNLVIWCDGDYWHGNNEYKKLTKRQKNQRRIDSSQNSYLNNRNINYLRFWGSDIKKNIEKCKKEIIKFIGDENE